MSRRTLVSADLMARIEGSGVTDRQVDYWARTGGITPTVPANGSGSRRQWSDRDVVRLRAIGAAHRAVLALGFSRHGVPTALVRRIWDGLQHADVVVIREAPITIHIDLNETP